MGEQNGYLPYPKGFSTAAIHHDQGPDKWDSLALTTPIVTSANYKYITPGNFKKYVYSRDGNPTREVLENVLAKLDNAKYGLAFASGSGAISTVLGLLNSGDHLISGNDIYGGTHALLNEFSTKYKIELTFVDLSDLSNLEKSIKKNTKLVWIETPTNPMMQVIDIKAVSKIAKKHNLIFAMDNTFLTSYLLRPLDFGVDIIAYSLSKYMNGHTDVIMGALVTSNTKYYEKLKSLQILMGICPSPFDCYQVNRGLKTLSLRMEKHNKSALIIAKYLENHPKVEKVLHPGLPSHPQHELFKKQTSGHSGTFSFYIKGNLETSNEFLTSLKVFTLAESLGGFESLAELPSKMTHACVPAEQRAELGITDTLLRLSVGLEDVEDLVADLEQAFNGL